MQKRGQITAFIIIGIIILIGAAILLYMHSNILKESVGAETAKSLEAVNLGSSIPVLVEHCLKESANEAILENGRRGGYFMLPDKSTAEIFENVPYYVYEKEVLLPANQTLEESIATYINSVFYLCLNFKQLEDIGYNVSYKEDAKIKVSLCPKELKLDANFPVAVKKDEQTKQFSEFSASISSEQFFNDMAAARKIVESLEGEGVCLSCFADISNENNLYVGILPYYNNTYVFDIKDNDYSINGEEYHLRFAVKYNENKK